MLGLVDGLPLNQISLLGVNPILLQHLPVRLVIVIKLLKVVILEGLVLPPLLGDLEASPHPHALDIIAAWNAVDAVAGEGVLTEVVEVADETVHQVGCEVVLDALA